MVALQGLLTGKVTRAVRRVNKHQLVTRVTTSSKSLLPAFMPNLKHGPVPDNFRPALGNTIGI